MDNYQKITELIYKHLTQNLSADETEELERWRNRSVDNERFFIEINHLPGLMNDVRLYDHAKANEDIAWTRLQAMIPDQAVEPNVRRIPWMRYAAAASILIAISITLYLYRNTSRPTNIPVVVHTLQSDAKPNTSHAFLTLDNGETIPLDSTNGLLAREGGMKVERKGNGLSYSTDGQSTTNKVLYNKVTVPKGSDVVYLQLSDQTKVWLNAESSIRYPVAFAADERKVEITGEAYFEVAKTQAPSNSPNGGGRKTPFIVSKGNMNVTVLGTKFNVNTYENEAEIKVTLLEGSVKVQQAQQEKVIKPGQQAVVNNSNINIVPEVDLQQVMAWKEGKFVFNNTNIQTIMHQMERWYDLSPTQFENEAVKKWEFNGEISRYSNASKVLELLEKTGSVKFVIEGKKISVKQL